MHKKTLIPYLIGDYNQILEDFQIEKIRSMEKEELLKHLKNSESWIYDFYLKQRSINLFFRTSGFLNVGLTVDDLYKIGVYMTIKQINKRYFFDLSADNILILEKINSRIKNNIINYFSNKRKINYFQFQNQIIQIDDSYEIFEEIIFELDLIKINRKTLKIGLKKVWEDSIGDMDFDIQDFEELCTKYGFTPLDVLIYNPYILPHMTKEACNNGNYQLVLVFDDEEVIA